MQKKTIVAAWLAAAAVGACLVQPLRNVSRLEVARASGEVAQLAADLAGVRAEFASRVTSGRHLGFDTYR